MQWLEDIFTLPWNAPPKIQICECGMQDQRLCDAEEEMGGCPYYQDMRLFDGKEKVEEQKRRHAVNNAVA